MAWCKNMKRRQKREDDIVRGQARLYRIKCPLLHYGTECQPFCEVIGETGKVWNCLPSGLYAVDIGGVNFKGDCMDPDELRDEPDTECWPKSAEEADSEGGVGLLWKILVPTVGGILIAGSITGILLVFLL